MYFSTSDTHLAIDMNHRTHTCSTLIRAHLMCFENVFMQCQNYRLKRHTDSLLMNHIYLTAIKSGLICIFIDIIIMFKLLEGHILTPQLRLTSRKKD